MVVCMLSIKLISDDMAELAFEFDLFSFLFFESMFSFLAGFSNLEAVDSVSFFKTLKTTKNIGTQICMFYNETV